MTFIKGQSGNPNGRPKGIKDRRILFQEMIEPHKNDLLNTAIEMAKSGNEQMLRLLLNRLLPAKPKDDPLPEIETLSCNPGEQSKKTISLITSGAITPIEGNNLLNAILAQAKIIKFSELVERVEELEISTNECKKIC